MKSIDIPIAAPLKALLTNLIDYAGLYPPAALPLRIVVERYRGFLASPDAWILNRLVLPFSKIRDVPVEDDWRITALVEDEPGPLPRQVQTLEVKLPHRLSLPTYCEAPIGQIADAYVKVRAGGLTADAIPTSEEMAEFLCEAAARRLPFKATAGLHHPVRSMRALTYAVDAPQAMMHGFLNVFLAAAFAYHGSKQALILQVINETDPAAFVFGERSVQWGALKLSTHQIAEARRHFAHSFGSCSFEEPVSDLRRLGLLP